eukprot:m.76088 g.76088  ORF g.76088 m.76088 type:complete len:85 (-) comp8505_c0_seq3:17-271(-)
MVLQELEVLMTLQSPLLLPHCSNWEAWVSKPASTLEVEALKGRFLLNETGNDISLQYLLADVYPKNKKITDWFDIINNKMINSR